MSSLAEIQEAIEKLGPEERAELWTWFQEAEETDELVAAVTFRDRLIAEAATLVRFPHRGRLMRRRGNVRKLVC